MSGKKAAKRAHAVAMRAAKLRRDGCSLSEISEATSIPREQIESRIKLGERLLQLVETEFGQ